MPRKRSGWKPRETEDDNSSFFDDDDLSSEKPVQRNAANARERARMRVLSKAFCRLKTTLPWVPADTKLSKLDTLRLATSYIAHLRSVLCLPDDVDHGHGPLEDKQTPHSAVHPLNLTWPYSFQLHTNAGSNSLTAPPAGDWKTRSTKETFSRDTGNQDHKNYSCKSETYDSQIAETLSLERCKLSPQFTQSRYSLLSADIATPPSKFEPKVVTVLGQNNVRHGWSTREDY